MTAAVPASDGRDRRRQTAAAAQVDRRRTSDSASDRPVSNPDKSSVSLMQKYQSCSVLLVAPGAGRLIDALNSHGRTAPIAYNGLFKGCALYLGVWYCENTGDLEVINVTSNDSNCLS